MRLFWRPNLGYNLASAHSFGTPPKFGHCVSHNRRAKAPPVHQFRFAGFPGRGGIRRTVSKPTEPLVAAKDPDSEVGPFYRFYYLRERGISSDMMPEDIWKNLIAIGIVDEQSAEEYFRSDRPVTTLFLDRAVAEGMPVQHA